MDTLGVGEAVVVDTLGVGAEVGAAGTPVDGEVATGATDVEGVVSPMVVDSPAVRAGEDCAVHRTQANAIRVKARFMAGIQWPSCK